MAKLGKPIRPSALRVADCVDIFRVRDAACAERVVDRVIVEEPVTIMVDRVGSFTVMCTPSDLEALAVGFIYSEGMIHGADDVLAIDTKEDLPNVIGIEIREPAQFGVARNLVVASSCGMCGVRNVQKMLADVPACPHSLQVPQQLLLDVAEKLRPLQTTFALTGSSHAAALFDRNGTILAFAEDIGRHNALDKVIGKCLLMRQTTRGGGVVLSGRVSLEMIAKAARAGVELVMAVSGVSSYAIAAALRWNITLCGFVRNGKINIYTDPTRIRLDHNGRYAHAG
ncbi:MAG: formate dehydrogenase accessory sulfurtransferase FdhD [Planctomycetes bacterium]|nr:formate dehydrogenase accessory sulfurtransferase FdhD [Planctomycetota bacterium]